MLDKVKQKLRPSKETTRTAKAALLQTLQVAEKALDGVPVPGLKAGVGAILEIARAMEKSSQNVKVLSQITKHVEVLQDDILTPILNASEISQETENALERLGSDMEEALKLWKNRTKYSSVRRFLESDTTAGDLQALLVDIKGMVERYQVGALARGELSNARLETRTAVIEDNIGRVKGDTTEMRGTTVRIEEATDEIQTHLQDASDSAAATERIRLINSLPRAEKAAFDSARDGGLSSCFEGTRVAVLDDIMTWVQSSDPDIPPVFWLVGLAGTGKSTIARSIAETARFNGWLGASFFFSRLMGGPLRDPNLVFPTIAHQLAQFRGEFSSTIGHALELNADLGHKEAEEQLFKLIIEPLIQAGPSDQVVLVVLDALDECISERGVANILQLLLAHASRIPFRFRIFLTSRPEHHLRSVFAKAKGFSKFVLHDIERSVVRDDIQRYIHAELCRIPAELDCPVPGGWPIQEDVDRLVDNSGALFVYAATVVRFIGNDRVRDPQRQLSVILGMKPVVNAKPYARLDQLYLQILTSAIPDDTEPEDVERYQVVVGSIARLRASLPLRSLASLTGYDIGQIRTALHHLHSVIVTPSSNEDPAQIYHPSFVDFLCNPQRCNDPRFFILTKDHERRLALRCLDLLKPSLKRNLAGIPDYVLIWDTFLGVMEDGEKAFVGRVLTPELEYCCRNWPSHLGATPCGDPLTMDALEDFASRRLLWWFEAASLVGVCVHIGAAMNNIYEWAVESRCTRRLCQLLHDGVRFSSRFEGVIKCSPHLIYQAGVVFLRPDTVLAQTYTHEVCTPRDLELTGFTYVDDFVATRHDVSALISSTTPPSVPENTDRWGLDDSPSTLFMREAALIAIAVMTINHGSRKASGNPFGAGLVPCLLSATDHRSERVRRAAWNCIYETCDLWTSQSSDDTLTLLARKAFRALLDENEHWEVTYAVANVTNRSLIWSPSIDVAQGLATRIGQLLLLSDKEIAGTAISLATRAIESEEDVTMRLRVMKEIGWRGIARWASHASPRGVRRKVLYALHRFACESTIAIDVLCSELGTTHLLDILASTLPPDPVHGAYEPLILLNTIITYGSMEHKRRILGHRGILEGLGSWLADEDKRVDRKDDRLDAGDCLLALAQAFGPHPVLCDPIMIASLESITLTAAGKGDELLVDIARDMLQILRPQPKDTVDTPCLNLLI